jgi:hypothetical protein
MYSLSLIANKSVLKQTQVCQLNLKTQLHKTTSLPNLKVRNIYNKPLLKPQNTYNKPCFETTYFGDNVKQLLKQKAAQNVSISLGYFIF